MWQHLDMKKRGRVRREPMPYLRAWRESLGLSRQAVVNKIGTINPDRDPPDQATLAKWEDGETAVRVEDLRLLAEVYGVTPDRLFFEPGDEATPDRYRRAFKVITEAAPEAVDQWLGMGELLRKRD